MHEFNLHDAQRFLVLCDLTQGPMEIGERCGNWILRVKFHDAATGTDAYLWQNGKDGALVYRGTEKNREDILTDLKFRFAIDQDGDVVHRGFLAAWNSIESDARIAISSLDIDTLYFVGHSLGGALATVAWSEHWPDELDVRAITYGAPRVAGDTFGVGIERPLDRIVNGYDFVPSLPFKFLGHRHVGRLILLQNETININPPWHDEVHRNALSLIPGSWQWGDHRMSRYAQALDNVEENFISGLVTEEYQMVMTEAAA